jgi:hypothetical protein
VALMHAERRLPHVAGVHADLMIAGAKVQLGEELRTWSSSRSSSTIRIGNLSLTVMAFSAR